MTCESTSSHPPDLSSRKTPLLLRSLVERPLDAAFAALAHANETHVRLDLTPAIAPSSPLRLANGSLVRPAQIAHLSLARVIALMREGERDYHAYVRYLSSDEAPHLADALRLRPLGSLLDANGLKQHIRAFNVWLGDGSMRSGLHYDGFDNVLLQLAGSKRVILYPPSAFHKLGYTPRPEYKWVVRSHDLSQSADGREGTAKVHFDGFAPTGGAPVENHASLNVFDDAAQTATSLEMGSAGPGEAIEDGRIECIVRAGDALYLPALWSHAVESSPHQAQSEPPLRAAAAAEPSSSTATSPAHASGSSTDLAASSVADAASTSLDGLNLAVNVWFVAPSVASIFAAVAAAPRWAEAHFVLGDNLGLLSRAQPAAAAYRRALELRPDYFDAQHNLASQLSALGNMDGAISAYEAAIRLRPQDPRTYTNRALLLRRLGRLPEAEQSYREALAAAPADARAWGGLGNTLALQEKLEAAADALAKAVDLAPRDAGALNSFGVVLEQLGRLGEAREAFIRAVRADPMHGKANENLRALGETIFTPAGIASSGIPVAGQPGLAAAEALSTIVPGEGGDVNHLEELTHKVASGPSRVFDSRIVPKEEL